MAAGLCQQLLAQLWEPKGVCRYAIVQGIIALCTAIVLLVSGKALEHYSVDFPHDSRATMQDCDY